MVSLFWSSRASVSPHLHRQAMDDRQPQPCVLPGAHPVGGEEPVEQVLNILWQQARRQVGETGDHHPIFLKRPDIQIPRAMLDRVLKQVGVDAQHGLGIAQDR